jgi:hypothetical protein
MVGYLRLLALFDMKFICIFGSVSGKEKTKSRAEAKRTKYMFTPSESNDVSDLHENLLSHRDAMHSSFAGGDTRYSDYDPPNFLEDMESDYSESETDSSDMEEDTDDDIPLLSGKVFLDS